MGTPSDRLDDAYLARKQAEEAADLLEWAERRAAPATTPTPEAEAEPPPTAGPSLVDDAGGAVTGTVARSQRILQEGGEAILRGAERLVEASPVGVAQRALAGEPPASPLAELQQAGAGALEIAGGMAAAPSVLVGQGALEQALVGAGLDEATARTGAELLTGLGLPIAAAKVPALAKALAGGSVSKRVLRELIGTPEPAAPPKAGAPEVRAPTPRPPADLRQTKVVDDQGQPTRVYHGTAQAFEDFDPNQADPNALFGPGLYFTDNPSVAGDYASGVGKADAAPNVRGAFLNITNPLDLDAPIPPKVAASVKQTFGRSAQEYADEGARLLGKARPDDIALGRVKTTAGDLLHGLLRQAGRDKPAVQAWLKSLGYDGMTHEGGRISGGTPHQVWIAFDATQVVSGFHAPTLLDSMDQIRALAKDWDSIRETARRGTRTHEQAAAEAKALPMSLDDVRALFPGTAMNDAQAVKLITVLVDLAENGQSLAREALDSGDAAQIDDALRAFALLMDADPKRSGVVAEAGRTTSVMNDPVSGMNAYLDAIVETLVEGAGLPKAALLARLARVRSKDAYAKLAKQLAQPTWKDAFTELWINGLLSGPPTHLVNALSNSLTTAWGIGTRITASAIGVTHGGLQPGEAYHALWGVLQGTKDGWRLAAKAFREGAPQTKLDQPVRRAIRGETFGLTGDTGRAIDYAGEFVRLPTRALMSADEFFKGINFRMELHAQAYRLAAEEGLTGKAAAARMADIIANPPPGVKAAADRFALHQTFQTELTGTFTTGVQTAFSGPVGKLFLPFIKTPTNIFKYSLENTILAPFLKSWRADVMAGGARRDLALAKVALGTSTMYVVTQYAADGRITGGGPKGPERDEWLDTHQPYSFRWGNKWVSYNRLDPVGMLVGFAADFAELSGEMDERTGGEFALALTAALAKNLSSKTYVKGVADLIDALEDPGSKVENVIGRLSRSLIPRAVAGLERVADPELRDPTPSPETQALFRTLERIYNEACSQTIGCSKSLPPRRNLFGDPIRLGYGEAWEWLNPIYVRDVNEDPVSQELVRLGVRLSMPGRALAVGMAGAKPIPLTPQEYDHLVQLAAGKAVTTPEGSTLRLADLDGRPMPTLRERLASLIQTAEYRRQTDGPDGGKARAVRGVVETYRDAAVLVLQGTPALKALMGKRLRDRGAALTPGGAPAVGVSP